ncbi:MAG TPA: MBL fold metallo-hydrolase [Bryobacteraceae bacterium]|nr:MBL fold metallo-hydrolase [Bryobacteraceae bacterium]
MTFKKFAGLFAAAMMPCALLAQAPPGAPAEPDSPEVKALIEKAKKAGGTKWAEEEHFFCEAPRANRADDPVIPATEIFDGVYIIGNAGTAAYVFKTSAGLLMFDSLSANQTESQLLPGFQKLGLNPADVKIIVMGHGHADHFGGSPYFQEHFGSKVYIATADWDMMEHPPAGQKKGPPVALPKHDADVKEGEPIVLGDLKLMPVAIPGHTPGSMGYIFPIKDNGKPHMAAIYGGTILTPGPISDDGLATYLKSVQKFEQETKKAKVDSIMQNHPLMYPLPTMLDELLSRKKGGPNPFIVGQGEYQKFLQVMELCSEANIARRK